VIRQRKTKQQRRAERDQALSRYTKQRQRNRLAKPGVHDFIVVLDHMKAGFNVAKIFRSAEAFGAHEIHLVNIGPFDPAPGKGAFKKVPARFFDSFDQCYRELTEQGYQMVRLEGGCERLLTNFQMSGKMAFILGHEEWGHSFRQEDYPDIIPLAIPQFGKVESLNVAVAASIVMYEYVRQSQTALGGPARPR
jgi:tRNA G18 (ribose-2'-O)-methylase SpoU